MSSLHEASTSLFLTPDVWNCCWRVPICDVGIGCRASFLIFGATAPRITNLQSCAAPGSMTMLVTDKLHRTTRLFSQAISRNVQPLTSLISQVPTVEAQKIPMAFPRIPSMPRALQTPKPCLKEALPLTTITIIYVASSYKVISRIYR